MIFFNNSQPFYKIPAAVVVVNGLSNFSNKLYLYYFLFEQITFIFIRIDVIKTNVIMTK